MRTNWCINGTSITIQVLTDLDPSAKHGPYANDALRSYTEVSQYMGGPTIERHAHWATKVSKGPDHDPTVLLVDFGVGIDDQGIIHLAAFGLAGSETTTGGLTAGPFEATAPMRTIQLEHAVDELVAQIAAQLPSLLLEVFARMG